MFAESSALQLDYNAVTPSMKNVYQISDLASREQLDLGADKPARLAVIGYPVSHSASPAMHQAALDDQGKDIRYIRLEVNPGEVAHAIGRMKALEFVGCNVTVPHKFEVIDCCDDLTDDARALGAVNTLIFGERTLGHNTDAPGFVRAIREDFDLDLADLKVMIVGVGGGAGKAIAIQCGRIDCKQLWLVNRTLAKAQDLKVNIQTLSKLNGKLSGQTACPDAIHAMATDDLNIVDAAKSADLIINATSLGLKEEDPMPIPVECIQPHHRVYDMIYNPANTALIKQAQSVGAHTANGSSMLLHQGVLAYESWFPGQSPLEEMRAGLLSTF